MVLIKELVIEISRYDKENQSKKCKNNQSLKIDSSSRREKNLG